MRKVAPSRAVDNCDAVVIRVAMVTSTFDTPLDGVHVY